MEVRIRFLGLDTRQINDDAVDGLLEFANNIRPQGTEDRIYWTPFKKWTPLSINSEIPEIPTIPCDENINAGGAGVTEYQLPLLQAGGVYAFSCLPYYIVDKFEILHNGVKVATSGMTVPNEGPFDDANETTSDQYIGTNKGSIPTRDATFQTETDLSGVAGTDRQMIWWVYDTNDFNANNTAILRVSGPGGTEWQIKRVCE